MSRHINPAVWPSAVKATLVLGALLCLAAAPALAADAASMEQAQAAWKKGQALFDKGDFRGARAEFLRGHELSKKGGFLFNAAECSRRLGENQEAIAIYKRYLREYDVARSRKEALQHCEALGGEHCLKDPAPASQPVLTPVVQPAQPYLPPAQPEPRPERRPFYKHWGLWAGVGAVVVAGSVTAIVLATRNGDSSLPGANHTVDFK